jgi:hypothetical protein
MRKALLAAVSIAALATSLGASAAGGATVTRESVAGVFTESGLANDCGPGTSGTLNGTGVTTTQVVENEHGFHVTGTSTGTGRIDWSDGSYTLIDSVDRFSFSAVGKGTTVFSETHKDSGDNYTADGVFRVRQTFHEVEHITVVDGVVHVDFAKGHFHVFGIC